MQNTWFTSDTHYHHKNIVKGTSDWKDLSESGSHQSLRDFSTLEEHDDALVTSFNSVIKENDILYHLGDWSFGGHEQIKLFRDRLTCKNIHLIYGNHDQHIEKLGSPYQGLFSSLDYYKEISFKIDSQISGRYGKTKMILSHYAHRVWNQSHHGTIHLYGHSHGTLPGVGKSMDVGVDTNNLYPYHLDEIVDKMKGVNTLLVDHHNENTN